MDGWPSDRRPVPRGSGAPREPLAPPGPPGADQDPAAHKPGFQPADLLLVLLGLLLLGIVLPQLWLGIEVLLGRTIQSSALRAVDLWLNGAILLVVFGLLPFFWVLGTRNEPWRGTVLYLRLHDPGRSSLLGIGLGIALIVALAVVGIVLERLGMAPENPALEPLTAILTVPLALFLSFSAAVGEEVLFRGVLQRWIGVWGQAGVFALLHAYQGLYGIVFTFLLALVFGFMVRRGGSLWVAISAHFTFDIVQMALLLYWGDL